MASASPQTTLSGTYWELHRNSLLLSSLLLIICVPGVKVAASQSFLWLSFSAVAFNGLRLIVACAATYSFVAYWTEWSAEALPLLRQSMGYARDLQDRSDKLLTSASTGINEALTQLQRTTESLRANVPAYRFDQDHLPAELEQAIATSKTNLLRNQEDLCPLYQDFFTSLRRMYASISHTQYSIWALGKLSISNAFNATAKQVAMLVYDNRITQTVSRLDQVTERVERLYFTLKSINDSQANLKAIALVTRFSVARLRIHSTMRLAGVGMAVPSAAYIVAVSHLSGQLGVAHWWSAFNLLAVGASR